MKFKINKPYNVMKKYGNTANVGCTNVHLVIKMYGYKGVMGKFMKRHSGQTRELKKLLYDQEIDAKEQMK